MTQLFDTVGPFAPVLVFVLAAAESAAFVGIFAPGELAVILGGVAAGTGGVPLWVMIPAAIAGAIVGDSIGYSLGSRLGPNLLDRPSMKRVSERMDSAAAMILERGWWALVVARFAAVLRAVVPFSAGMARMPYRRFLLGNSVGGVLWGTTFTLVGYFAGANYARVEGWIRTGGLAIVAVLALVGGIAMTTRWISRNRDRSTAVLERIAGVGPIRALIETIERSGRPATALVLSALGAVAGMWVFGGLAQDVIGTEEFFLLDISAIRYLDANRVPGLVSLARGIDAATDPRLLTTLVALGSLVALVAGRFRLLGAMVTATLGQWLIVEITATLVDRSPPGVVPLVARMDYGFPSEHAALASALAVFVAWVWHGSSWRSSVLRFGAATLIVTLIGTARIVLLVEYPSDVMAGAAVAAAWTLLVCLTYARRGDSPST